MLPEDVFRTRLQAAIADLAQWTRSIGDVAQPAISEGPGFWKLSVLPQAAGACPFELLLRADQKLDFALAGETYEDRPMPPADRLLPLVEAIEQGRIVERHWVSLATGAEVAVETIITPARSQPWRDRRDAGLGSPRDGQAHVQIRDRHFLPYRRLTQP